ncbi:UNVERIFIED_CONTAM: hypothetical protein Slati_3400600, partial [Sesamum latifolium]
MTSPSLSRSASPPPSASPRFALASPSPCRSPSLEISLPLLPFPSTVIVAPSLTLRLFCRLLYL